MKNRNSNNNYNKVKDKTPIKNNNKQGKQIPIRTMKQKLPNYSPDTKNQTSFQSYNNKINNNHSKINSSINDIQINNPNTQRNINHRDRLNKSEISSFNNETYKKFMDKAQEKKKLLIEKENKKLFI